jgi:hypothetical protein
MYLAEERIANSLYGYGFGERWPWGEHAIFVAAEKVNSGLILDGVYPLEICIRYTVTHLPQIFDPRMGSVHDVLFPSFSRDCGTRTIIHKVEREDGTQFTGHPAKLIPVSRSERRWGTSRRRY